MNLFKLFRDALAFVGVMGLRFDGGGGGSSTATQYTSNIPEYASGAFMNLVGKSEALSDAPYQAYTGQRIQGFDNLQNQSFDRAGGLASASFLNPGMSQAYMSPYMQNVVDIQKREAARDADIARTQRNAQAVKAGAFGGSRQAIMDAEANRNLMTQMGDIQGRGLQSAFEQGQRQFNTEFGQQMDTTQMLNQLGGQRQQLGQRQLDQQYADFQAQRDYPYQQLGFLSDILRGVSGSTRTMYSTQPRASGLQTLAGLGTAAAGLFAEGGEVKFAEGGAISVGGLPGQLAGMSDKMLQSYTEMHKDDPIAVALALSESKRRARLRQAAAVPSEQPEGSVVDREIASMDPAESGIAAAAPDMEFAEGGIIGYAEGGLTDDELRRIEEEALWASGEIPSRSPFENFGRSLRGGKSIAEYYGETPAPVGPRADSKAIEVSEAAKRASARNQGIAAAAPAAAATPAAKAPPPAPTGRTGVSGSASVRQSQGLGALSTGTSAMPDFGLDAAEKQARADIEASAKLRRDAAQEDLAAFEADVAQRGKAGEAKEARIKEQQAGLSGKEQDAKRMALVQAGLSILSADPSRGAFAAIGEGALKGLGAYKGDMKDIEATREQLATQLDGIEELRRQEAIATGTEKRRLRAEIRKAEMAGADAMAELSRKLGLEVKPKMRMEAWKELQQNARTQATIAGTIKAASMRDSGGGQESRAQRDADAAYARNPEVVMLLKQAEDPMVRNNPIQQRAIVNRLSQIQGSIYQQYGLTMAAPPAQAGGSTANDPLGIR